MEQNKATKADLVREVATLRSRLRMIEAGRPIPASAIPDTERRIRLKNSEKMLLESEARLRESERQYHLLAENVRDVVWTMDMQGRFTYVSPSVTQQTGFLPEDYYEMSLNSILTPESASHVMAVLRKKLQRPPGKHVESVILELQEQMKGGGVIDVEVHASWLRGEDGLGGIIGITRNITERKRAEQALRESEERCRALSSFAMEGIAVHANGIILDANRAFAKIAGVPNPEWLIGKKFLETMPLSPESIPLVQEQLQGATAEPCDAVIHYPTGELKHLLVRGQTATLRERAVGIISALDITDRKRGEEERQTLQEQLTQALKMEAVGRLAGGVAHDFNNLLTTILGYSELILNRLSQEDPLRVEMQEIRKAGERAASLTQQLLAFSRKQVIQPRIIDLNAAVKEAHQMLRRLIGENIQLVYSLSPILGRVKADPHQIDQVLLNLAVNARDAMPDGGVLTIATSNARISAEDARTYSNISPGSYVVLSVTDTGIGITAETKSRLFEPFFTTKEKGKGTGLGLAMIYGIAKQNGGTISVHSEPGCGAEFRFYLPYVFEAPEVIAGASQGASPTGNETILLVEDETMVRRLAQRLLKRLGYEVLEADGINEAIRICTDYGDPIHLLLTDVVMPGMSGIELYSSLREIRAEMKAMFMSGYSEDAVLRHGILTDGSEFIQKPFNMEDLANRLRSVLDRE